MRISKLFKSVKRYLPLRQSAHNSSFINDYIMERREQVGARCTLDLTKYLFMTRLHDVAR